MTALVAAERERTGTREAVRVLHVMGMRAAGIASAGAPPGVQPRRRQRPTAAATSTEWLPIHDWALEDVRELHEREQLELHYAYRLGMTARVLFAVHPRRPRRPRPRRRAASGSRRAL